MFTRLSLALTVGLLSTPAFAGAGYGGTFSTSGEDGVTELFADAVEDYSGTGMKSLGVCTDEVQAWITNLAGLTSNYKYYYDSTAWSSDFESTFDGYYADAADFSYFSGHGSTYAFYFNGSSGDDVGTSWETSFGSDVEFVHFSSCNTLDAASRTNWAAWNLNDGVHWLFGFQSQALDVTTTGSLDGYYLANGYYVDTAWWLATDAGHPTANDSAGVPYTSSSLQFTSSACNTWWDRGTSYTCDPTSGAWTAEYTYTL